MNPSIQLSEQLKSFFFRDMRTLRVGLLVRTSTAPSGVHSDKSILDKRRCICQCYNWYNATKGGSGHEK